MHMRTVVPVACLAIALAACAQRPRKPEPPEPPPVAATPVPPPRFTVAAATNDTWNAIGQILVRTAGVAHEGRAQMLGLHAIRYRGAPLRILARALPLSDGIARTTTEVTVTGPKDTPVDGAAVIDLMVLLQRELPAEIASVRAQFAAAKKAQEQKARKKKKARK